jgi:hypothetical protein
MKFSGLVLCITPLAYIQKPHKESQGEITTVTPIGQDMLRILVTLCQNLEGRGNTMFLSIPHTKINSYIYKSFLLQADPEGILLFYCPSQAFCVGTNYILTRQTP